MKLTEACIKKPVFAWMLMTATVVFGMVAVSRIGISQFPDVDFPTITVSLSWPGAAPEVIEHDVVELVEDAVVQVEGIRSMTAVARSGGATVTLELDISRDVDVALQDVQTKIAQAQRRLPSDLEPAVVSKTNPEDQPIMWVGVSGAFSPQLLADYARYRVRDRLQTVSGVGEVMMGGYLERNVRVWVDLDALDAKHLAIGDVLEALRREHVEMPAGQLESRAREVNVRVMGEALDLETLRRIVVRSGAGAPVYLSDVALVEDGFEDVRRVARVNGAPVQGMGIKKQRGSNAVAVARAVRRSLEEIRRTLPSGMEAVVMFDSSQFIEESVKEIEFELLIAVALTALVCWLFLGSLSSTLNVILAIPMSLLGTIATIYFFGFTLNTFTLLGLALAVGIVVDDAIMVLENIFRHAEGGKDRVRAAREGTAEITFAALAATLAVVAIFLPVVFMKGIVGRFFLQFGVTLTVAVLLSYIEAVTLAPARCSQFLQTSREGRSRFGRWVDARFATLASGYERILGAALRHPVWVLCGAALLMGLAIIVLARLPGEFVPSQDQSRLLVRLQTAVGASIQEMDELQKKAEEFVNGRPEVNRAFSVAGSMGGGTAAPVNNGIMFITLVPPSERQLTQQEFSQLLRKKLNSIPGISAQVQDLSQAGFTAQRGFPIEFSVRGADWNALVAATDTLKDELSASGLVVDLDTDYRVGMPELRLSPDRARAADVGVSIDQLAETVNSLVGGVRAGKFTSAGRRVDVRLRLLSDQRKRPEDISRLKVRTGSGQLVPLSALVKEEVRPAIQAITRQERERAIRVFGNVAPGHAQAEALAKVEELASAFPEGIHAVLGGASVAFKESMSGLVFALVLGILVAYMVLASQFNSFLHPVTVLTILPLSVAGAAFALLLAEKSLNIFSMIGLLLLMGIVKKNSIILVDYATRARGEGLDARSAMRRAGPVRLRPILMTSISTLMAALPAALGLGAGAEIRTPMAIAVVGGVVVSTALSLLVVPAFYVVADAARARVFQLFKHTSGTPASNRL